MVFQYFVPSVKLLINSYFVAGILTSIENHFGLTDDKSGLLQTAFVVSYMVFAPVFGYLGDRYSRRAIMAAGVFLWSITTLLGSFMEVNLVQCMVETKSKL